jgi:hypothetical protein
MAASEPSQKSSGTRTASFGQYTDEFFCSMGLEACVLRVFPGKNPLDSMALVTYTRRLFLNMLRLRTTHLLGIALLVAASSIKAQTPYRSSEEFAKYAMKLREAALSAIEPRVSLPTTARDTYKWKTDIITTIFWAGESASANNPVHNYSSAWDLNWATSFGGFDNPAPEARLTGTDYRPRAFIPKQNPFYCALPYNDVTRGTTKPESRTVIPWFRSAFVKEGQSVCRDRWVAVRNRRLNRIAYCQWSDCGPFRTDHYQYVFGKEKPLPNLNGAAGLDVSPSVRDYLGLANTDTTDWRFVEAREVPPGPWRKYGENNPFYQQAMQQANPLVKADSVVRKSGPAAEPTPNVVVR